MTPYFILQLLLIISFVRSFSVTNCTYYESNTKGPEAYFINLKRSRNRRKSMRELLSAMRLLHFRVNAATSDNVYVPDDLSQQSTDTSFPEVYKYRTKEAIDKSIQAMQQSKKIHLVNGVATRGILWTELYCTLSHLQAIYHAVHSPTAVSNYALIMEDDIHIPISTDFNALAESAPSDFGILQLLTVNDRKVAELWGLYTSRKGQIWSKRDSNLYWSTGIYLINRKKLRPIIDAIVRIDPQYPDIIQYRVIAAKPRRSEDIPRECSSFFQTKESLACIPVGNIVADRYLYSMTVTYMFHLPIAYAQSKFKTTVQVNESSMSIINHDLENTIMNQLVQIKRGDVTNPPFPYKVACEIETDNNRAI